MSSLVNLFFQNEDSYNEDDDHDFDPAKHASDSNDENDDDDDEEGDDQLTASEQGDGNTTMKSSKSLKTQRKRPRRTAEDLPSDDELFQMSTLIKKEQDEDSCRPPMEPIDFFADLAQRPAASVTALDNKTEPVVSTPSRKRQRKSGSGKASPGSRAESNQRLAPSIPFTPDFVQLMNTRDESVLRVINDIRQSRPACVELWRRHDELKDDIAAQRKVQRDFVASRDRVKAQLDLINGTVAEMFSRIADSLADDGRWPHNVAMRLRQDIPKERVQMLLTLLKDNMMKGGKR